MRSIYQRCTSIPFLSRYSWHRETNRSCYWANSQTRYALLTNAVIKFVFSYRRRFFNLYLTLSDILHFLSFHSLALSFLSRLELPPSFVTPERFTNTKSKINCFSSWQSRFPDFTLFSSSIYFD